MQKGCHALTLPIECAVRMPVITGTETAHCEGRQPEPSSLVMIRVSRCTSGEPRMDESFTLRLIDIEALPRALEKAERYRLLSEPQEAESICEDVLAADPNNQRAIVMLTLALTDQSDTDDARVNDARDWARRLTDAYERIYYEGLTWEREGRALLKRRHGSEFAYDFFRAAMDCYEQASAISPPNDDDAILRWNTCVRTIQRKHLAPRPDEPELLLE